MPKGVLWAPKRIVFKYTGNYTSVNTWDSNEISDLLWLPTERELFGDTNLSAETVVSQARLEYYDSPAKRKKYWKESSDAEIYWQATSGRYHFHVVDRNGFSSAERNDMPLGCVPAFCVR